MKHEIEAMKEALLALMSHLGGMAENLKEAGEWAGDARAEEAKLSLEAVGAGAEDAHDELRKIALQCAEITSRKAVAA